MNKESVAPTEYLTEENEPICLYRSKDGFVAITREDFISLTDDERSFVILCRDSEEGIFPFLVAEDDWYLLDFYGSNVDEEGVAHILPGLPGSQHFGIVDDDSLLELSTKGKNGGILLHRFHWCIFTPFEEDSSGETFELRYATTSKGDAEFVAKEFGCCDPLLVPIVDEAYEVV